MGGFCFSNMQRDFATKAKNTNTQNTISASKAEKNGSSNTASNIKYPINAPKIPSPKKSPQKNSKILGKNASKLPKKDIIDTLNQLKVCFKVSPMRAPHRLRLHQPNTHKSKS